MSYSATLRDASRSERRSGGCPAYALLQPVFLGPAPYFLDFILVECLAEMLPIRGALPVPIPPAVGQLVGDLDENAKAMILSIHAQSRALTVPRRSMPRHPRSRRRR